MSLTMKTAAAARRTPTRRPIVRATRSVIEGLEGRQLFTASLALTNPFSAPAGDRLIFNRIGNPNTLAPANVVHDRQVLTLTNNGNTALNVDSLVLSGPFQFVSTTATPLPENGYNGLTVAAGQSLSVTVQFVQNAVPAHSTNQTNFTDNTNAGAFIGGSLTVNSDAANTPTRVVSLAGYYQTVSNANAEPSLQTVINRVGGYQTNLGLTGGAVDFLQPNGQQLYGSEIYAANWSAADAAAPVTVQQIAAFHTQGNTATLYWYKASNQANNRLFQSTAAQGQTILPTTSNTNATPLTASFNPGGAFGLRVDGEYSNDAINNAGGNTAEGGHHFRFWPVVTAAGAVVPNSYIVAMDYAEAQTPNADFQDNVYVVNNIRPATTPDTPTNFAAARGVNPVLTWTASTYNAAPVGYNVSRATVPAGPFTRLTPAPIGATTYTDTTAPAGAALYYQVTAVDSTQNPVAESPPATVRANGGPTSADYTFAAITATAQVVNPLANVTDNTGTVQPATVTITQAPSGGGTATVDPTNGQITYASRAGFAGPETVQYTVADSNGETSTPGTVTFNVSATNTTPTPSPTPTPTPPPGTGTGILTVNPFVAQAIVNTPLVIPVLTADAAATTFVPGSVTIVTQAGNGNAVANADGTITYNPGQNVVGNTTFTYTVQDANGTTSSPATVSVDVGVPVGAGTAFRRLTYTSENQVPAQVQLNRGTATVYFDGTGTLIAQRTTANIQGTDLFARAIGLAGTNAASVLSLIAPGNRQVRLGGVFGSTLGILNAPTANLLTNGGSAAAVPGNANPAGAISLDGARAIRLRSATNGRIDVRNGTPSTSLQIGTDATGTSYSSLVPVTQLRANNWNSNASAAPGPITAPTLGTLIVPGTFSPDLTLTAPAGRGRSLNVARVGNVTNGTWTIGGNTGPIVLGAAGTGFGGLSVGGSVANLIVNSGNLTANVAALSIGVLQVAGTLAGDVHTAGNLNVLTVGDLQGSAVTVGTNATLANVTATNVGGGVLRSFAVRSRAANAFADSSIVAGTIFSASTGQVNAAAGTQGLAANTIRTAIVGLNGTALRLNPVTLATQQSLNDYLTGRGANLGAFTITLV